MFQTVNFMDFRDAFRSMDRLENFSRAGHIVLFDYLEQIETETGYGVELDVIALCCDYAEDSPEDIAKNFSIDLDGVSDVSEAVLDWLNEQTIVCGVTPAGDIVYCSNF